MKTNKFDWSDFSYTNFNPKKYTIPQLIEIKEESCKVKYDFQLFMGKALILLGIALCMLLIGIIMCPSRNWQDIDLTRVYIITPIIIILITTALWGGIKIYRRNFRKERDWQQKMKRMQRKIDEEINQRDDKK
ncbi:hypothetical protein KKH82_04470 [Patescibacteria group bacterium]|nr:hypothetical protein [Patescibacteria group bacterium]